MPRTIARPLAPPRSVRRVTPSIVDPAVAEPFTLDQELTPFGAWVGAPIWVPPKDAELALAETMLRESRPFASRATRWQQVLRKHRSLFTQVREFDLFQPSIRLPQGKFFVTVTEREDFDKITDRIPNCVQTRLEEFLAGPGQKRDVKVYYLKPLCVEVGDELLLTTRDDLTTAIESVQRDVFARYRRLALYRRPLQVLRKAVDAGLAVPRAAIRSVAERRQRAIAAYHARLEFTRRKLALEVAREYRKYNTDRCTFDDALALTSPVDRTNVIEQYCLEEELSDAMRKYLLLRAAAAIPWFLVPALTVQFVAAVLASDPVFVAELPTQRGVLLKIGHFDEVAGVTHIEL
jgi:hypothetical protein